MSLDQFRRPFDVVKHPTLEPEVKRAILASWASDQAAITNRPDLRRPKGLKRPVPVRDIFAALKKLDRQTGERT
ncbi:MAG: hypothetical protein J7485_04845 [Sphingobium sp.]|nr:hypothetical protein [Sphingobium sp.]